MGDETFPPDGDSIGVRGILGKIVAFLWVGLEIEKEFPPQAGFPDVFPMAISEKLHAGGGTPALADFSMQPFPPSAIPSQTFHQTGSLHLRRDFHPGDVEAGGHDIPQFHHLIAHLLRGYLHFIGESDDERNAGRCLQCAGFSDPLMVAEHLAMIGNKNDHRVGGDHLENAGKLIVDVVDATVVAGAELLHLRRRQNSFPTRDWKAGTVWLRIFPIAGDKLRQICMDVAVPINLRRRAGLVRLMVADIQKKRNGGITPFQKSHRTIGHPVGEVNLLWQVKRPCHPTVFIRSMRHPGPGHLEPLFLEPPRVICMLLMRCIGPIGAHKSMKLALGMEMEFAAKMRLIAGFGEFSGQGRTFKDGIVVGENSMATS